MHGRVPTETHVRSPYAVDTVDFKVVRSVNGVEVEYRKGPMFSEETETRLETG